MAMSSFDIWIQYVIIFSDPDIWRWKGTASIPLDYFPANIDKFNFYSIHGTDNNGFGLKRTYKSFKPVPGDYPDFHRLEYFESISDDSTNLLFSLKNRQSQSKMWNAALDK